jgi:Uma2 family endonuclease
MVEPLYTLDPDDPRAPPREVWEQLNPAEQKRVVEMLPVHVPGSMRATEGDAHREAKTDALDTLGTFFRRIGRRAYLSSGLAVYYPDQPCIVPDVLVVLDVDTHARMKWVVDKERRGVDFVLEVHMVGDASGEHDRRLVHYAELGITEYFLFDRGRFGLRGFRLPSPEAMEYEPITPQGGRLGSAVLGLDLTAHSGKLRFFHGTKPLLEPDQLVGELEAKVDELQNEKAELERSLAETKKYAEREKERADRLDRVNARLQKEIAELQRGTPGTR